MKPKITIIDGNNEIELSTIEDNVKAYMVKGESGEDGYSPTITTERNDKITTITIVDKDGTKEADIYDGFDPEVSLTKESNVVTLSITDINGTQSTNIRDGVDLTGGVPTNGVIGFDSDEIIYTCDGTETGDYYLTYNTVEYYFTMPVVADGDILVFNTDDLELSLDGTTIVTSSTGTGTELTFSINLPNGYEITNEPFPGAGSITVHDNYSTSTTEPYSANYINGVILNKVYPIGSIYMSVNSTNPSSIFGGTWVAWGSGRVPVGVDTSQTEFDTIEETGGEKTHTLTVQEMPSHTHALSDSSTKVASINQYGGMSGSSGGIGEATLNNTGGGQAHNNLQPYITCYMWKRTA